MATPGPIDHRARTGLSPTPRPTAVACRGLISPGRSVGVLTLRLNFFLTLEANESGLLSPKLKLRSNGRTVFWLAVRSALLTVWFGYLSSLHA